MDFTQKLIRLTANVNKSKLAKDAGLPVTAISNYITKKQIPRGDTALLLARVLRVPLEWLLDDTQDWPPPPASIGAATTEELAEELGRRMAGVGTVMLAKIMRAERADWVEIAQKLLAMDVREPLGKRLMETVEIPGQLNLFDNELRHFDPYTQVGEHAPPELLKQVLPRFEISVLDLWIRHHNLRDKPGYNVAHQLAALWLIPAEFRPPWFDENIQHARETAAAALKQFEAKERDQIKPASPTTRPASGTPQSSRNRREIRGK